MPATNKNAPDLGYTCSTCGRKGHNSRGCTNRNSRIDKVGVEVEGYWDDLIAAKAEAARLGMGRGCRDGSLGDAYDGAWEFQTVPGPLGSALEQVKAIYPDNYAADCGMHVHVSFKDAPITVGMFACQEFFDYWASRWDAFGRAKNIAASSEFWRRLRGENTYCRRPNVSMFYDRCNVVDMDRYNQINFSAWAEHRTIESRLLPLFRDSALALAAITETVDIFDTWAQTRGPEILAAACAPIVATFSPAEIRRIVGEGEIDLPPPEFAATEAEIDLYDDAPTPGMTRIPVASVARILGAPDVD